MSSERQVKVLIDLADDNARLLASVYRYRRLLGECRDAFNSVRGNKLDVHFSRGMAERIDGELRKDNGEQGSH